MVMMLRYMWVLILSYLQFSNAAPTRYYDYNECLSKPNRSLEHFSKKYKSYWQDMDYWVKTNEPELTQKYSQIYAQLNPTDPLSGCEPVILSLGIYAKCTEYGDHNIVPRIQKYLSLVTSTEATDGDKCKWLSENGPLFHAAINRKKVLIGKCDLDGAVSEIVKTGQCGLKEIVEE